MTSRLRAVKSNGLGSPPGKNGSSWTPSQETTEHHKNLVNTLLGRAVSGASYLVLAQGLSRYLTFLLNVVLTRSLPVNQTGLIVLAHVQLWLVYVTFYVKFLQ